MNFKRIFFFNFFFKNCFLNLNDVNSLNYIFIIIFGIFWIKLRGKGGGVVVFKCIFFYIILVVVLFCLFWDICIVIKFDVVCIGIVMLVWEFCIIVFV